MAYQEALEALGDGTRRAIFESLARRPESVGALAGRFPVSRPAVSQHLRVLREAGLVSVERDGTRAVYRVDPAGLEQLRAYLDGFWTSALDSFKKAAESKKAADSKKRKGRKHGTR